MNSKPLMWTHSSELVLVWVAPLMVRGDYAMSNQKQKVEQ